MSSNTIKHNSAKIRRKQGCVETGSTSEGWEKGSVWPGDMRDRTEVGREAQGTGSSERDEWHRQTPSLVRILIFAFAHRTGERRGVSPAAAQVWQRALQKQTLFLL